MSKRYWDASYTEASAPDQSNEVNDDECDQDHVQDMIIKGKLLPSFLRDLSQDIQSISLPGLLTAG